MGNAGMEKESITWLMDDNANASTKASDFEEEKAGSTEASNGCGLMKASERDGCVSKGISEQGRCENPEGRERHRTVALPCSRDFPCCRQAASCCLSPIPGRPLLPAAQSAVGACSNDGIDNAGAAVVQRKCGVATCSSDTVENPPCLEVADLAKVGACSSGSAESACLPGVPPKIAIAGEIPPTTLIADEVSEPTPKPDVFVRTFGHFDIFVNGKPIIFKSPKEKELVALLVDREGGTITSEEAMSCLWENQIIDEKTKNRYRKLCQRTRKTLESQGLQGLMEESRGVRNLNRGMVTCDYYEMMEGNEHYSHKFGGRYLSNYSWAEPTLGMILRIMLRRNGRDKDAATR